jgi:hypothetical protein
MKIHKIESESCSLISNWELFLVVSISMAVGILDFALGFDTAFLLSE